MFLKLSARLGDLIERNVSIDRLIESKRHVNNVFLNLTAHLGGVLNLNEEKAADLLMSLIVLLAGASQLDEGPDIDPAILPEDLAATHRALTSDSIFMKAAGLILSGIRVNT